MVPQYWPMIPTLVAKPFHRDGFVYEEKVDGYRRGGRNRADSAGQCYR